MIVLKVILLVLAILVGAAALLAFANRSRHLKLLDSMDITEPVRQAARASFADAKKRSAGVLFYDLSAPIVMALVVLFLSRDANKMPRAFRKWDNEVSMNGDGWAVKRNGEWVRLTDAPLPGEAPVSYSDPAYDGDAYYASGHHPRSAWARYVWLGWRNRASAASAEAGIEITPEMIARHEYFGDIQTSKSHEGVLLRRIDQHFQLYSCKKLGPLCIRTNYGFKLGNSVAFNRSPAMVVTIAFSVLSWKGEK